MIRRFFLSPLAVVASKNVCKVLYLHSFFVPLIHFHDLANFILKRWLAICKWNVGDKTIAFKRSRDKVWRQTRPYINCHKHRVGKAINCRKKSTKEERSGLPQRNVVHVAEISHFTVLHVSKCWATQLSKANSQQQQQQKMFTLSTANKFATTIAAALCASYESKDSKVRIFFLHFSFLIYLLLSFSSLFSIIHNSFVLMEACLHTYARTLKWHILW